jgi:MFS family permease
MPPSDNYSTAATSSKVKQTYRELFTNREFTALFIAHVASIVGDRLATIALALLIYERTDSEILTALTYSVAYLPYLAGAFILPLALRAAPPRLTLVATNLISAILVALIAILESNVPAMLALMFTVGVLGAIFSGVRAATLPSMLEKHNYVVLGRAAIRSAAQLAAISGSVLGGLTLAVISPRLALTFDSLTFLFAAALFGFFMRSRSGFADSGKTADSSTSASHPRRTALSHPLARRLLLFSWFLPACVISVAAVSVPYTRQLGLAPHITGYLVTMVPLGVLVGDVLISRFLNDGGQLRTAQWCGWLSAVSLLLAAWVPPFPIALALLFLAGLGLSFGPGLDRLFMSELPPPVRTNALAYSGVGLVASQGVGILLWGTIAEYTSVSAPLAAAGLLAGVTTLWLAPRAGHFGT